MGMKKVVLILFIILIFVGCDRGQHLDVGPILVDKDLLPDNVEVKNK
jgi:hypothetical protein